MAEVMTLTEATYVTQRTGSAHFDITDGGRVRVQIKDNAEAVIDTILDETLPPGKKWEAHVVISIEETDA